MKSARSAFTLVEVLIAVAVTSLIVVMIGLMFGSLTNTSSRANQRIDTFRDARAALQMIQRDLSHLVHATPAAYLALDDRYSDPNTAPQKNRQVYGLAATKNGSLGDLCAMGYYCRWEGNRYTLRRYFRDGNELSADAAYFSSYNPKRSVPLWNFVGNGAGNYMASDHLYQPSDTNDPGKNLFQDETLAAYVWNLQITAYKTDGSVDSTYPLIMNPASPTTKLPAAVEISFRAISPEAAKPVMATSSNPNDWMDENSAIYTRLIKPHAYNFRTRVNL